MTFSWGIFASYIYSHKKNKDKKIRKIIYVILIILPLVLLSSFRGNVGTDTLRIYYPYFLKYIDGNTIYLGKEYGFLYFNKLCHNIFSDYSGFLFCIATLIWGCYYIELFKKEELKTNLIIYYAGLFCIFFAPSLNIMRQSIACSIIFIAYRFVIEKKKVAFFIAVVIATLFHSSAILFLPMYLIYCFVQGKNKSIRTYIAIVLCVFIIFVFPIMFEKMSMISLFDKYTANYSGLLVSRARWNKLIIRVPLYIGELITIYNHRKKIKADSVMLFYIIAIVLEIISLFFGFYMEWAFRLAYYFSLAHIIYWGKMTMYLTSKRKKQIMTMIVVLLFIFYFLLGHVRLNYDQIIPYAFN